MDVVDLREQRCCATSVSGDPVYGGGTLGIWEEFFHDGDDSVDPSTKVSLA